MTARVVYAIGVVIVFIIEVAIGAGVIGGTFVRGSVGDILVIVLIYFLFRATLHRIPLQSAGLAISVGFIVEALQSIHVADMLGLKQGSLLYIIVGNTYSSFDLVMYVIGGLLALVVDGYVLSPWITNLAKAVGEDNKR